MGRRRRWWPRPPGSPVVVSCSTSLADCHVHDFPLFEHRHDLAGVRSRVTDSRGGHLLLLQYLCSWVCQSTRSGCGGAPREARFAAVGDEKQGAVSTPIWDCSASATVRTGSAASFAVLLRATREVRSSTPAWPRSRRRCGTSGFPLCLRLRRRRLTAVILTIRLDLSNSY